MQENREAPATRQEARGGGRGRYQWRVRVGLGLGRTICPRHARIPISPLVPRPCQCGARRSLLRRDSRPISADKRQEIRKKGTSRTQEGEGVLPSPPPDRALLEAHSHSSRTCKREDNNSRQPASRGAHRHLHVIVHRRHAPPPPSTPLPSPTPPDRGGEAETESCATARRSEVAATRGGRRRQVRKGKGGLKVGEGGLAADGVPILCMSDSSYLLFHLLPRLTIPPPPHPTHPAHSFTSSSVLHP